MIVYANVGSDSPYTFVWPAVAVTVIGRAASVTVVAMLETEL